MNVQQTIIKGIKEQLFFNNYLVLPGFGGFVLKSRPSHFSASGGLLLPPSKTVSFNLQLKQNDGILAVWLQNKLTCSASEALTHLTDFSGFCMGVLSAKRRLTIDGVGFFFMDFENNICFEPQQDSNFLSESFGLMPLSIKPLEVEAHKAKKETVFVDRTLVRAEIKPEKVFSKRNFRNALYPIIVAALSMSLLFLIVGHSKSGGLLYSSLFDTKTIGVYTPIHYTELNLPVAAQLKTSYVADANGIATVEFADKKTLALVAVENKSNATTINHSLSIASHKQGYEIVLGCFTVLSNAKRMNTQLNSQNIQTNISTKNAKGMYVISDGNFESKTEAIKRLQELKVLFPKAWIKKGE